MRDCLDHWGRWAAAGFSTLALTVTAGACVEPVSDEATASTSAPIIGGVPVAEGDYPSIVAVLTNKGSLCTGSLITPTVVLTAGHCTDPQFLAQPGQPPPTDVEYYVTTKLDVHGLTDADRLPVAGVESHAAFPNIDFATAFEKGPKQWNDISLVTLAAPLTGVPLMPLALDDSDELTVGGAYKVAGYGMTNNADNTQAGILTAGSSDLDEIGDWELAVGDQDPQQACRGDSGGPVMTQAGVQLGIASRVNIALLPPPSAPPPCETGLLYTRVSAYADWLRERVPELDDAPQPESPDAGTDEPEPEGPDAGTDEPEPGSDAGNGGNNDGDETGGCGCQTGDSTGAGVGAGLFALGVALFAFRRRRD